MADLQTTLTRLLTALSASDPTWDTSVGSATYKIMESVAQELANVSNNSTLLSFGLSIETKSGTELDAFVNLFGINRQLGVRATGYVTFSTNVGATQDYQIPLGTTVYAPSATMGTNIGFTTTSPGVLGTGLTSVQVPIIAVLPGAQGNIAANTVTNFATALQGITAVANSTSFTGGIDVETDAQLRQRFLNTAFSNFAGTASKFNSVAKQLPTVNRVSILSAQQQYPESLQVNTVLSGNANFKLGLNTQAILSVSANGDTTATLLSGKLPDYDNMTVASSSPAIFTGTVTYDGATYSLSTAATGSGIIYVNHTISGSTVLTGASTVSGVTTEVSSLLSTGGYSTVTLTTTGTTPSGTMAVAFAQNTPWNLIVTSGTVSGTNTLTSQIPDAKYYYPAGTEYVGVNIGTTSQQLWNRTVDYNYTQVTGNGASLLTQTVSLIPNYTNAPYTFTGHTVQLQTQYIPLSSRVTTSGASILNPNYIDIYLDDTSTQNVSEQVIMITGNTISASGGGGTFSADKYITATGSSPTTSDIYVNLSQGPVANFPAQIVPGTAPNYMTFGIYDFPIALTRETGVTVAGFTGVSGTSTVTTTGTISGLQPGLVASGTSLGVGNYIVTLTSGVPNSLVLSDPLPATISNQSVTWVSVAYPVYDNTTNAGSILDLTGVAVRPSDPTRAYGSSYLTSGSNYRVGTLAHNYYSNVSIIDNVEQQARVVGTNLLVHEVDWVNLVVNLSIVYGDTNDISSANNSIQNAVSGYLSTVPIGSTVSFAGILRAVFSSNGVALARITSSGTNPVNYGLSSVHLNGSNKGLPYTKDILLNSNQAPRLFSINFTTFGYNNF